ncbi:MAG: cytochrome C [Acidobacteriota bacterium]|nr:cytochrome C [Acidobacteriota bacterium]
MKKKSAFLLTILAAVLWTVMVAPVLANGAGNGITNSPHDFSSEAWNDRGEICRVCHVPHDHGRTRGLEGLLWNHALSTASYTMYSSSTLDGAADAQPTGITKMCLGCHDGTVAIDDFDNHNGGTNFIGTGDQIPQLSDGGNPDLRATHPISIVYDTADTGLHPTSNTMGGSGTIADVLEAGKVQCHSCHDVHDAPGEAVANTHLLRVAQTTSQGGNPSGLCLTCHDK